MIRHTILFKVRDSVTQEELNSAVHGFYALKNKLKGDITSLFAGECYFQDEKSDQFFAGAVSHAIAIDFYDRAALERFFKDPVTYSAKEAIVKIAEGGYEGIVGFDFY